MVSEIDDRDNRDETGPSVSYPVRYLLREIRDDQRAGFATLTESLNGKADKADVADIRSHLRSHHERLESLEDDRKQAQIKATVRVENAGAAERRFSRRERFAASLIATAGVVAIFLAPHIH